MASKFMKARKMRNRHTREYRDLNRLDDVAWQRKHRGLRKAQDEKNQSFDPLWPEDQYEKSTNLKSKTQMEDTGKPLIEPVRTEAVKPQSLVEGTPGFL